ncbi:hypothetical protein ACTG9Q_26615 [Actinokineospora sp. 24-640]
MTYGQDQSGGYPNSPYQGLSTPAGGQQYGQYPPSAPIPAQTPARTPKPGRGPVVVLVVLLVLAVIGTGTFVTLWMMERGEHTTTQEALAERERSLSASQQKVGETEDQLAKAEEDRRVAETKVGELTKCRQAGKDLLESLDGGDTPANREKTTDALDRMDSFC